MADGEPTHAHHEGAMLPLMEKADSRVDYRASDPQGWQCGGCRFFDAMCSECNLVEGSIDPTWTCNLWKERMAPAGVPATGYGEGELETSFQMFIEAQALKAGIDFTQPSWIPFLPKPGKYQNPRFGEINITSGTNAAMVLSVKNKVYQEHIPLDAEHETKLSGAVGYIRDMRMNDNGSADALIEWSDRGQQLVGTGRFRYVSPEWFKAWTDPGTGEVHKDVVAGGAITTRPFFKDKALRALVASEAGSELIAPEKNSEGDQMAGEDTKGKGNAEGDPEEDPTKAADPKKDETKTYSATEVDQRITAMEQSFAEKMTELEGKVTAAEALAASEKEAREEATTRLAEITATTRSERFADIIAGRGGENDGARWVGEAEKHLNLLNKLSEQFGEDNELVTDYIEQQNAVAAQAAENKLFATVGAGVPAASSPEGRLEALTKAQMASEPALSFSEAQAKVLETDEGKKLYELIG